MPSCQLVAKVMFTTVSYVTPRLFCDLPPSSRRFDFHSHNFPTSEVHLPPPPSHSVPSVPSHHSTMPPRLPTRALTLPLAQPVASTSALPRKLSPRGACAKLHTSSTFPGNARARSAAFCAKTRPSQIVRIVVVELGALTAAQLSLVGGQLSVGQEPIRCPRRSKGRERGRHQEGVLWCELEGNLAEGS